jgi:uncharacterized membrane protein YphA (DoxX/SURF4 family)
MASVKMVEFIAKLRSHRIFSLFTWLTRILLCIGFLPPGIKKIAGMPFTALGLEAPVGYFFDALYNSGFYYQFIGWAQLMAAVLLVIPRTATVGALIYFPIITNIFVLTVSSRFAGTPFITGIMVLANAYLLLWDYQKLKALF